MILTDFIEHIERTIRALGIPVSVWNGANGMQNVLVYQSSFEPHQWIATDWPGQQVQIARSTKEAVREAYLTENNINRDDVRFFGPVLTTVELTVDEMGTWTATATADRPYTTSANSQEEVKAQFVEMWNSEYIANHGGELITDENVDWFGAAS